MRAFGIHKGWRRSSALAVGVILAGCATSTTPVPTYSGTQRAANQVAIFKCGWNTVVKSIDGNAHFTGQPLNCTYALLPGRHRFRVKFEQDHDGMVVSSKNDYIVTLKLVAGRKYSLNAVLKDNLNASMPWEVKLTDSARKKLIPVTTVRQAR